MVLKRLLCLIEGHRYNHELEPEPEPEPERERSVTVICNRCGRTITPADLRR